MSLDSNIKFLGVNSDLIDLTEKKDSKNNSKTEYYSLDDIRGYKVYTALLTQSGTNAPVATVLENTFDITPNWIRVSEGNYKINEATCLLMGINLSNSIMFLTSENNTIRYFIGVIYDDGDGVLTQITQFLKVNNEFVDNFFNLGVEIRVYN